MRSLALACFDQRRRGRPARGRNANGDFSRTEGSMSFSPDALRFFRQLATHNENPWFEAHRGDYESHVREPMSFLIEQVNARFARFAPEIGGDPKRSMFRI